MNSRLSPTTRYPSPMVSSSPPARDSGRIAIAASSVAPALAVAMTTWSARPAATQRAPRVGTGQPSAGGRLARAAAPIEATRNSPLTTVNAAITQTVQRGTSAIARASTVTTAP